MELIGSFLESQPFITLFLATGLYYAIVQTRFFGVPLGIGSQIKNHPYTNHGGTGKQWHHLTCRIPPTTSSGLLHPSKHNTDK